MGSTSSSPGECSDGADNDSDGDYDCNDSDCFGAPVCNDDSDASDASDLSDSSDASDASDVSDSSDASDASDVSDPSNSNCEPDCSGRECGDDGCGGSCGTCDADETCNTATGQCVSDCSPNCLGRECGDDGCGGSCGSCGPNSACDESGECIEGCVIGTAQCTDAYAYEICGPDASSPTGSSYGWRIPCQEGNSCSLGSCSGACLAPEILLLVDRSSSMNAGGRWDFVEDSIVDFVQSYQHQASIGLRMFPLGASCSAGNILSLSYENASSVSSGLVDPSADSQTPISAAFEDVLPAFGDPAEGQYIILITDGDETCSENSNASVGMVAELARSGVDTFAIGISTQANLSLLNDIADAGRTSSSDTANDSNELSAVLTSIYQDMSGCYCGDGEVTASYASQSGAGEDCDDGNNQTETCSEGVDICLVCDSSCNEAVGYSPYCGDGIISSPEVCDDGNTFNNDYCSSDCLNVTSVCGDGDLGPGEVCDDGNTSNDDYCSNDCQSITSICGDADVGPGEVCEEDSLCSTLEPVFYAGIAFCNENCMSFDFSSCVAEGTEEMVFVPFGSFWMGCNEEVDNECDTDESPYHEVYLDSFHIDTYEVTAGAYKACVDAGICIYNGDSNERNTYNNSRDNHPINNVTPIEAETYCEWVGKRLPTEAEWEKAARGTDGRKYPWGNTPIVSCTHAVLPIPGVGSSTVGCGTGQTWPVGSKPLGISPYGVHDMIGNVWEWTADWYSQTYYQNTPNGGWINPQGPDSDSFRVKRGGTFTSSNLSLFRTSDRDFANPQTANYMYGFRCAK